MELAAFMGILSSWTARRTSTSTPSVRSFYHALMIGVLAQWLMDPKQRPSARDLTEALRAVTTEIKSSAKPGK
jgi:hypothetical protein